MSWLKYPYRKIPLDKKDELYGSSILKPIIPIVVSGGERFVIYDALIDSGADFCIFHAEVGEALGLDICRGKKRDFSGIQKTSKRSEAFLHKVALSVQGFGRHKIETLIAFSYQISDYGFGILGQKGFLEHFPVKFDYRKGAIEIQVRD